MSYVDKLDKGNRVEKALKEIRRKEFNDDANARLFAATSSLSFIHHIIQSVVFQTSIMSYGRVELYLCLPPQIFRVRSPNLVCQTLIKYVLDIFRF